MSELAFPITVAIFVYLVVVPLLTVACAAMLRAARERIDHVHEYGSLAVWGTLVAPVVLSIIWFFSGAMHQFDGHHALAACIVAHAETHCIETLLLALLLLAPLIVVAARRRAELAPGTADAELNGVPIARRHGVIGLVCTRGLVRPIIEVDETLENRLSVDEFDAVLQHEHAHATSRDPLLYWILRFCLAVNPASALLHRDAAGWELAREVRCDLRAVAAGTDRFVLAQALVRVASVAKSPSPHCGFVGAMDKLDLRVRVLCADQLPAPAVERSIAPALILLLVLAATHRTEHGLIDWLHRASEQVWLTHIL